MADPLTDKLTRHQGSDIADEFEIPGKPAGSDRFVLGGLGIGTKPASIRVRILKNGDIQYFSAVEGEEPKRVVPTDDERAMVEQVITSRKEANPPPKTQTADEARKAKADADKAEVDARKATEGQSENARRIEAANATVAEANARKATTPATITRTVPTPGTTPALDDPRSRTTERVTTEQDASDRAWQAEQRAGQQAILQQMQQAEANALTRASQGIARDRLSFDQARAQYQDELDKIRLAGDEQSRQLMQRGQDIQVRGQDVNAEVTMQGQRMNYEEGLARSGTDLAKAQLPYWNAPGQLESFNSLMAGKGPVPTRPSPPPFSPDLPLQLAMQARGQMPGQFQLPPIPGQVVPGKYTLQGLPTG